MATQTYQGTEIPARLATGEEENTIQHILNLKDKIKAHYEEIEFLMSTLPAGEAMVANLVDTDTGGEVVKTIIVGTPTGHYVNYKEKDLVMNAKTTKKLLKELGGQ